MPTGQNTKSIHKNFPLSNIFKPKLQTIYVQAFFYSIFPAFETVGLFYVTIHICLPSPSILKPEIINLLYLPFLYQMLSDPKFIGLSHVLIHESPPSSHIIQLEILRPKFESIMFKNCSLLHIQNQRHYIALIIKLKFTSFLC